MAIDRLVGAFGQHRLVTVLTRCGLPLPVYFLADEQHRHCLTDTVYLPTIVHGRVLWHLGDTEEASAAAFTQSYQEFQRVVWQHEPTYRGLLPRPCEILLQERIWQPTKPKTISFSSSHNHFPPEDTTK
jgi:hypothetical protein